jgi:transcriptional regulator with XRE-family HTH domain
MSKTEATFVNTKPENWTKLIEREYRHALAEAQFKRFVPFQIGALRKERGWSQQVLAENAGVTQGVISKAEDPDNGNLTVNTILRIANGFDVVFVGKFMSYSEFGDWRNGLSEKTVVLGFEKENEKFEKEFVSAGLLSLHRDGNKPSPEADTTKEQKSNNLVSFTDLVNKIRGEEQSRDGTFAMAAAGGQ